MIYKYRRHNCKDCIDTINLDLDLLPDNLTIEKLSFMKSKLHLASNNFFRLIRTAQSILLDYCMHGNILVRSAFVQIVNNVTLIECQLSALVNTGQNLYVMWCMITFFWDLKPLLQEKNKSK